MSVVNVWSGKCQLGIVYSGKCQSGKCLVGYMSSGKCQSGIRVRVIVLRAHVRSGKCPVTVFIASFAKASKML